MNIIVVPSIGETVSIAVSGDTTCASFKQRLTELIDDESAYVGIVGKLLLGDVELEEGDTLDANGVLPDAKLFCIVEDPSTLCAAALSVLKNETAHRNLWRYESSGDRPEIRERLHLGTCRRLGEFPTQEWKEDPRMADFMEYHNYSFCRYNVLELTIIDGSGQPARLLGVINDGDADCNSGFWGSVYLRPSFTEIGGIVSSGDTESSWEINDAAWYVEPSPPLPKNRNDLCGGSNAESPLETHLSHALAAAMGYSTDEDEFDDEDDEEILGEDEMDVGD